MTTVTAKSRTISNGTIPDAVPVEANFTELYNNDQTLATAVTNLESGSMTISGTKTFSSATPFSNGITLSGTPATNGGMGYASNQFKGYRNGSLLNFLMAGDASTKTVTSRSSNTIWAAADLGAVFVCTSTFTQTITAAATLGAGWFCYIRNDGSGVITIDPNSSETIDGLTTITLGPGAGCLIFCDGTGFKTIGRNIEYVLLQDQKAQNTAGGTFTSGAWRTRDLNTEVTDTANNCSLASNQFTLQPGTYRIKASAPGYLVNAHQAKLRNITDGSDVLLGTSEYAHGSYALTIRSWVAGQFTITAAKTFELQHQCGTSQSTTGLGQPANLTTEIYSVVELWKVA